MAGSFVLLILAAVRLAPQAPDTARVRIAASRAGPAVQAFYEARSYSPAWTDAGGATAPGRELAAAIAGLDRDGLEPARYGVARIERLLARGADSAAALDVVLTAAFLTAGRHLALGRVRPETVDTMWRAAPPSVDVPAALRRAAEQQRPAAELGALAPPHPAYHALRVALARYRAMARESGWPLVGPGPVLGPGDSGARVAALRRRLVVEGDLPRASGATFDSATTEAVRRFQRRHGLAEDGRVGPATAAALDVTAARRARQIALNLERWRWAPREAGVAPIIVNAAAFTVTRRLPDGSTFESAAIVGRQNWPTPISAGTLTGVVFAPVWRVPRDILLTEILPSAAGDTGWLARNGFRIVDSTGTPLPVDSGTRAALADPARGLGLVQPAGPLNPLGGVKLVFDNPFNVCVHGTPEVRLFEQPARALSHGCVRVQRSTELATSVLVGRPEWTADAIARAVADTVERSVPLADGAVVIVGYWTAWVADDGAVQLRPDVYGWDAKLDRALGRR